MLGGLSATVIPKVPSAKALSSILAFSIEQQERRKPILQWKARQAQVANYIIKAGELNFAQLGDAYSWAHTQASAAPEIAAEEPLGPFQESETQPTQKNLTRGLKTGSQKLLVGGNGDPAALPGTETEASAAPETAVEELLGPFQGSKTQPTHKNLTRGLEMGSQTPPLGGCLHLGPHRWASCGPRGLSARSLSAVWRRTLWRGFWCRGAAALGAGLPWVALGAGALRLLQYAVDFDRLSDPFG